MSPLSGGILMITLLIKPDLLSPLGHSSTPYPQGPYILLLWNCGPQNPNRDGLFRARFVNGSIYGPFGQLPQNPHKP